MAGRSQAAAGSLLAALALVACSEDGPRRVSLSDPTGGPSATARAGASASASAGAGATARPSAAPATAVVLAVVVGEGPVELYRVRPGDREATLRLTLQKPSPEAVATQVSLSGGPQPAVCVVYRASSSDEHGAPPHSLVCHAPGAAHGTPVAAASWPTTVAVDASGRHVAWADLHGPSGTQDLEHGTLHAGQVRLVGQVPPDSERDRNAFTGSGISALAWVDATSVAVSVGVESDDGPDVKVVELGTRRGWLHGRAVRPSTADRRSGYVTYDDVLAVAGGVALAVERGSWMDEHAVPARAVRVDLRDGSVEQVVAVPAAGRDVIAVSGGAHALYVTQARDGSDRVASLRWPGEPKGGRLSGLPAGFDLVLAQP